MVVVVVVVIVVVVVGGGSGDGSDPRIEVVVSADRSTSKSSNRTIMS